MFDRRSFDARLRRLTVTVVHRALVAVVVAGCSGPAGPARPPGLATASPDVNVPAGVDAGPSLPPPVDPDRFEIVAVPASGTVLGLVTLAALPARVAVAPRRGASTCGGGAAAPLEVAANGGVVGVVVWLEAARGVGPPPDPPPAEIVLEGCRPRPRAVRLTAAAAGLSVRSESPARHVVTVTHLGEPWLGRPQAHVIASFPLPLEGGAYTVATTAPGLLRIDSDQAPDQPAFALVPRHAYAAVTDADGRYRIDTVPPGRYTVRAWQPAVTGVPAPLVAVAAGDVIEGGAVEVNLSLGEPGAAAAPPPPADPTGPADPAAPAP
jgi:hypothetical protein